MNFSPLEEKIIKSARETGGIMDWSRYINFCLFDPKFGYYAKQKLRVGKDGADFYTASSLKRKVFGRLLNACAENILKSKGANETVFERVEIGAEPNSCITESAKILRLGDDLILPQNTILFSNELLDARPFSRFKFIGGKWSKAYLDFSSGSFPPREIFLPSDESETALLEKYFPKAKVQDFRIDFSFDACGMLEKLCGQEWRGMLLFADYFRSSEELSILPGGTARTYFRHTQGENFFSEVGNTDITFSPCSDPLIDIALECGFSEAFATSQEDFFMKYATEEIRKIATSPDPFSPDKRELAQLLSPAHMGSCFRILYAARF